MSRDPTQTFYTIETLDRKQDRDHHHKIEDFWSTATKTTHKRKLYTRVVNIEEALFQKELDLESLIQINSKKLVHFTAARSTT